MNAVILVAACLWLMASSNRAHAQDVATPAIIGTTVAIEKTTDFRTQPLGVLARFPQAGAAMARFVASLAVRDPGVVDALLSTISVSSPEQASAMGAGLVRAVRAMEAKQSRAARVIASKIMRSTNQWLKTTFLAIGPAYAADAPLILPEPLPPSPRANTLVGTELPPEKSVLGPERYGSNLARAPGALGNDILNPSSVMNQDGTIVALIADGPLVSAIASTPAVNGGAPTSF